MKTDKTKEQIRKERHHITQEDFTPSSIVEEMFSSLPDELFTNFSKTFLDPCCGIGNILIYVLKQRLSHCHSPEDVEESLSSLYGTELMEDNVEECKENILEVLDNSGIPYNKGNVLTIINHNIVCTDFFNWDFDNWKPKPKFSTVALF